MLVTPERVAELRTIIRTPVAYPSADFEATRGHLAAAVPDLLDTIDALCRCLDHLAREEGPA